MSRIGQVVFSADGKAGLHCGSDHDGNELVAWLGAPEVVATQIDDEKTGDGTAAYSSSYPAPEADKRS